MRFSTELHLEQIDEKDKFRFADLSKNILNQVLLQMEAPNVLGIFGNWGSGKSTILHFLMSHIRKDAKHLRTVYFHPWKYEYANSRDLLYALLKKIEAELGNKDAKKNRQWKELGSSLLTIGAWALKYGTAGAIDMKAISEDLEHFDKLVGLHDEWVDETEAFQSKFEAVINASLKDGETLLVVIDDLDRCLPENAVTLLESMKTLFFAKRTLFLVALDKRVVAEMISNKFGLRNNYGDEYLMKIIPYFVELPRVEIESVVKDMCAVFDITKEQEMMTYFAEFLRRFAPEPRKAKYYIHQFGMRLALGGKELREKLSTPYTQSDSNQASRLADFFMLSFIAATFPNLFSQGHPESVLGVAYSKATDPNSRYKTDQQVAAMLSANEWNLLGRVLRFGYWQTQRNGHQMQPERINQTLPLLSKY